MNEVYDLRANWTDGEMEQEALTIEDGKQLVTEPAPFKPYCYIEDEDVDLDKLDFYGVGVGDGHPDGYTKIVADHPSVIRDLQDEAMPTYEADVSFAQRICIDTDVSFARPEPEDILFFDIEADDSKGFANADRANRRILSIAGVSGDGETMYFTGDDEKELIKDFVTAADEYVVLAGWNSLDYDFKYLENRSPKVGIKPDWSRWVKLDMMPLYDMLGVPTKTVSLKLDDVGQDEVGAGKTDVEAGDGRLKELWEREPEKLREYNVQDCQILHDLDEKYGLIELLYVVCEICNYPPGNSCYVDKYGKTRFGIGQVVDSKLLEVAKRRGIPQPNRGEFDKPDDFPGGYVLEPKRGMYENVVVPDYSGMYPNIVRSFNFGRETWYPDEEALREEYPSAKVIRGETGVFAHPDEAGRSVPAEAADELIEMRANASDILDKGIKAVNNTLYGVFAADFHRYFGPHSENITLIGQRLTGVVEDLAGQEHSDIDEVIYGDTDSVMISMDSPNDAIEAAHRIAEDLETEMKKWARGRGAMAQYLMLDVDDVYVRFYIGDKKKRYFGRRIWDGEQCDNIKIRGFECRKSDYPHPVRQFQRDLIDAKLADEPVRPIIEDYRTRLHDGEYDDALAKRVGLGKPIDKYDGTPPVHVRAAEAINEEFGANTVSPGDKVGYIKYGDDTDNWTWYHREQLGRPLHVRHYGYLWQNSFKSVMKSINVSEYEQTGLSTFA